MTTPRAELSDCLSMFHDAYQVFCNYSPEEQVVILDFNQNIQSKHSAFQGKTLRELYLLLVLYDTRLKNRPLPHIQNTKTLLRGVIASRERQGETITPPPALTEPSWASVLKTIPSHLRNLFTKQCTNSGLVHRFFYRHQLNQPEHYQVMVTTIEKIGLAGKFYAE